MVLPIGIGGGRYDEHAVLGRKSKDKEGKCACSLIARDLGVDRDPAVKHVLDYITARDTRGGDDPFGLYKTINLLNRTDPSGHAQLEQQDLVEWSLKALEAKIRDITHKKQFDVYYIAMLILAEAKNQEESHAAYTWLEIALDAHAAQRKAFFETSAKVFKEVATVTPIMGPHDELITLVYAETDDPYIATFARSDHGANADIVVIKRSPNEHYGHEHGQTQIFTDKRSNLKLHELVAMLRHEEQRLAGKFVETRWKQLRVRSKAYEYDLWLYMEQAEMLLNGSDTAPNIPGSAIPLEQIVEFVKIAMNLNDYNPDHADDCLDGQCPGGKDCSWYNWGLTRCTRNRAQHHRGT